MPFQVNNEIRIHPLYQDVESTWDEDDHGAYLPGQFLGRNVREIDFLPGAIITTFDIGGEFWYDPDLLIKNSEEDNPRTWVRDPARTRWNPYERA